MARSDWPEYAKDYHEALREFIRGDHEVFFPFGTYRMLRTYRLRCLSPRRTSPSRDSG
jgi:hypothetical protein